MISYMKTYVSEFTRKFELVAQGLTLDRDPKASDALVFHLSLDSLSLFLKFLSVMGIEVQNSGHIWFWYDQYPVYSNLDIGLLVAGVYNESTEQLVLSPHSYFYIDDHGVKIPSADLDSLILKVRRADSFSMISSMS